MDANSWRPLLTCALAILDDLRARGFGAPDFSLGGGTVLMMRMNHRLSKDIDLFLHDSRWLRLLTPRLNDHAAALARSYSEQANSVKIVVAGGDIDFIVAGAVTGVDPRETLEFDGWSAPLDSTEEILAKKLFFRAALLKPRDIFDLVAAHGADPGATAVAVSSSASRRIEQLRRLKRLESVPLAELERDISWIAPFGDILPTMVAEATALIEAGA